MSTRRWSIAVGAVIGLTALVLPSMGAAGGDAGSSGVAPVNADHGIALKGYDPVAYFTTGHPTPGLAEHGYRWQGVTYRFASAENRERFAADPRRYAPQYGGYCAYAMAINRIADIDPARWAVVDGKLYLNNNRLAHTLWSFNREGNIDSANRNWAAFPKTPEVP